MRRRIRYGVAVSLDGYIAAPNGEADWIIMDPEIDFAGSSAASTRGIPFLPSPAPQVSLTLTSHRLYSQSGSMSLEYDIIRPSQGSPRD